jgi:hypothetical protein
MLIGSLSPNSPSTTGFANDGSSHVCGTNPSTLSGNRCIDPSSHGGGLQELKICNTADDVADADTAYRLFAVVVHMGSGPNHGHYVAVVTTLNSQLNSIQG